MAWDKDNGYFDPENGWYDRDHSEEYWRGMWDTFQYLKDVGKGDFFDTELAGNAKYLIPEYTEE